MVVVVADCSVVTGDGRHKLVMNSVVDPTGGVVGACVSGCPSSVDGLLPSRDYIGLTELLLSPS